MRSATSRYERNPGRVGLLTTATVVVIVMVFATTFAPDVAEAWPTPRYECYCSNCNVGYFICRNHDYSCNCVDCSCYNDIHVAAKILTPRHKNGTIIIRLILQHATNNGRVLGVYPGKFGKCRSHFITFYFSFFCVKFLTSLIF